jgi:hypothetical protein
MIHKDQLIQLKDLHWIDWDSDTSSGNQTAWFQVKEATHKQIGDWRFYGAAEPIKKMSLGNLANQKMLKAYQKAFATRKPLENPVVLIINHCIYDGNHRAAAAWKEKKPLLYIDLAKPLTTAK